MKGKQVLFLIRHPLCYSYIQSSLIKVVSVIEERKNLRKKENAHCHFIHGYFSNAQPDRDN